VRARAYLNASQLKQSSLFVILLARVDSPLRFGSDDMLKRSKAVPKLSEIVIDEAPQPVPPFKTAPANAPANVVLCKVTDEAADLWDDCVPGAPLYQIQIEHAARGSITYQIRDTFNAFLRECENHVPDSLDALQSACGIRLVVGGDDPFEVGFVKWRPTFYVVGDLKNFLLLLDGWFKHVAHAVARECPIEVHLHPNADVDVAGALSDLEYEHYVLSVPSKRLPLDFFEGTPIFGKEIVWVTGPRASSDSNKGYTMGRPSNFGPSAKVSETEQFHYKGDRD